MAWETDQAENIHGQVPELDETTADETARRRVLEYTEDLLNCEHTGDAQANADAIKNSAPIINEWETVSDQPDKVEKRIDMLGHVGEQMESVHGAPVEPIVAADLGPDEFGNHDHSHIEINNRLLEKNDPGDALETYLHEYRHAEQEYEARNAREEWVNPDRESLIAYNLEREHYIDPKKDPEGYWQQLVEVDARRFGGETLHEILMFRDFLRSRERLTEFLAHERADAIARARLRSEQSSGS
jgi:hypothetical protein